MAKRDREMTLAIAGLNHKSAPVELREKLDFGDDDVRRALKELKEMDELREAVVLSTCNRVEIIVYLEDEDTDIEILGEFLSSYHNIESEKLDQYLYYYTKRDALKHLFMVCASLDSMVVGEPQILGQAKEALNAAKESLAADRYLQRAFQRAYSAAKRVRTETGIGDRAVSVGYTAVELAKQIFSHLYEHSVMIIGAGETAETVAENLLSSGAKSLYVANRTFEKGEKLAGKYGGTAVKYDQIADYMIDTDIMVSSTGSAEPIFTKKDFTSFAKKRKNKPLFAIDIAVPRDIESDVNDLDSVFLYDIDDLKGIVEENLQKRKKEAQKGEEIIEEEVDSFVQYLKSLKVDPVVKDLRSKIDEIRENEVERCKNLLSDIEPDQEEAIEKMSQSLVNKILHNPIINLKENAKNGNSKEATEILRSLFELEPEKKNEPENRDQSE